MELRITQGKQDTVLEQLSGQLEEHKVAMVTLTEAINKSRGALAAIGFIATGVGTIGGWLAHVFTVDRH